MTFVTLGDFCRMQYEGSLGHEPPVENDVCCHAGTGETISAFLTPDHTVNTLDNGDYSRLLVLKPTKRL